MHYAIITLLTVIRLAIFAWMVDLPILEASPYSVRLWCNYLASALVLWCPLLLTKRRRWTYAVSLLLDIWLIGNLIYFRSYGDLLNRWCLLNVGNMDGIWEAVFPFVRTKDQIFLVFTLSWILLCENMPQINRPTLPRRLAVSVACLSICCVPQAMVCMKSELPLSPFAAYYADVSMGRLWYVHTYGAITHLANETVQLLRHNDPEAEEVKPSEVEAYMQDTGQVGEQGNLLLIIVESLEDRVVGLRIDGQEVTPHINRLAEHPMSGRYAVQAQVKEGKSSDAQLIIFNGLLPLYNGAASMRYSTNTYPSLLHYTSAGSRLLLAAYPEHMWNQRANALAYGFDSIYATEMSDNRLMQLSAKAVLHAKQPFVVTAVTMASHSPFNAYADSADIRITAPEYSADEARYMQCLHYTDHAIGTLLDTLFADSEIARTTRIVITGDHPIFDMHNPVPLVIYDPFMPPVEVSRTLYQADIYTTLIERMQLPTPWRGLGRDIADTTAYTPSEQMYRLSDRMIRTNYFSH